MQHEPCVICKAPATCHISYARQGVHVGKGNLCGPHAADIFRDIRPLTNLAISEFSYQHLSLETI